MQSSMLLRLAASAVVAVCLMLGSGALTPVAQVAPPKPAGHQPGMRLAFRLPEVDGTAYTPNARNIAIRSATAGPLLLFLPATRAVPRDYRSFLETASSLGYHVLALDYWNLGLSVARTCGVEASCYGDVQANRFDGSHPGIHSSVAPADSILARLTHALALLSDRDPAGGWSRYLSRDHVRWSRVVLAGHSQGGGESAYIAHHHEVQGVLMFASPVATDGSAVASWMAARGATPMGRYYGFDDVHDVYFQRIQRSWAALGVGGSRPPVAVTAGLPFAGGHRMLSNVELGTPGQAHGRVIADSGPRTRSGSPVFQPVWHWMLQAVRVPTAQQ